MALQTVTLTSTSPTTWTVPTRCFIIRELFMVGGGGTGATPSAGSVPGGAGGGGRVTIDNDIAVTPGTNISYRAGPSDTATTFSGYSAAAGSPGSTNVGGASGRNISGSAASTTGSTGGTTAIGSTGGGGGAGAGGNGLADASGTTGNSGGPGFLYKGNFYGGGGGGGGGRYDQSTTRTIKGGASGTGGGGSGGGEGLNGAPGTANTGGGGGGGCASGTSTERTATGGTPNPGAGYVGRAATSGGSGGSGIIIINYDEAEFTFKTNLPGVSDGNSIIVYMYTKNVTNGSVFPYTISGAGITAADFNPATLTGSFTVSSTDGGISGVASTTITIATDSGVTEGEEIALLTLNNGVAFTSFKIGDLYQNAVANTADYPGGLVIGRSYTIVTAGTTIWTDLGAANNNVATTFTATATGLVTAGNFVNGRSYTITFAGNTDFTKFGASSNTVGVTFTATGSGFINATAMVASQKYTVVTIGTTDYTAVGAGWIDVAAFQAGEVYTIKTLGTTTNTQWNNIAGTSGITYTVGMVITVATVITTGGGTGRALPETYTVSTGLTFTVTGPGTGTGTVMPATSLTLGTDLGTASQGSGVASGIWVSKTIQVADYNDIQSKVSGILGVGSGNSGYGQTVFSNQITTSNRVAVTDWTTLKYDIINAYIHQIGTTPTLINASVGETVRAHTVSAPYRQYATWADVLLTQKFDIASSQAITRTAPVGLGSWYSETAWPGSLGTTWTTRVYSLISVYWPTAAAARAFFNSGGEIRFLSARNGGTSTGAIAAQNANWTAFLAGVGTVGFGGNYPIADTGSLNGGNFYRLSNAFGAWHTATATNPYSTNSYKIYARTPGITDNSAGIASSIEFQVEWTDNHTGIGGATEGVDGTLSISLSTLEATGTLLPGGSGNFQVTTPTIQVTQAPTT
jgi:hypothetical protein